MLHTLPQRRQLFNKLLTERKMSGVIWAPAEAGTPQQLEKYMSLEEAVKDNTAAVRELIEVTRQANAGRDAALAAAANLQSGKAATTTGKGSTKGSTTKPPEEKKNTTESVSAFVGDWLKEVEDGPARQPRKDFVRACFNELGVGNMKEVSKQEDLDKIHDWVSRKKAGEDVKFGAAAPDDDLGV